MAQGDATGRQLVIWSPLSGLTQGSGTGQFEGNSIYPRGISIRANFSVSTSFDSLLVRFIFFWSRSVAAYGTGQIFNSTTRANAGPVQVPPFANPRIFNGLTSLWTPYVGDNWSTPFDVTNAKIIKVKSKLINKQSTNDGVTPVAIYFRFPKRRLVWQDPAEGSLSVAPNYPLIGNYYVAMQVFQNTGAANIASATVAVMDITGYTYFKDPSG